MLDEYSVKILNIEQVTPDVKRFVFEKPESFVYVPGQASLVSILDNPKTGIFRPFTFTSLNSDNYLEFTIKIYQDHNGVTKELDKLTPGDTLIIKKPFGAISYKGKGVFIAGGAGITPFIAILRQLSQDNLISGNRLLFSNKMEGDIIYHRELLSMFKNTPQDLHLYLTRQVMDGYNSGHITKDAIHKVLHTDDIIYVCGPNEFVSTIKGFVIELGFLPESIVW